MAVSEVPFRNWPCNTNITLTARTDPVVCKNDKTVLRNLPNFYGMNQSPRERKASQKMSGFPLFGKPATVMNF